MSSPIRERLWGRGAHIGIIAEIIHDWAISKGWWQEGADRSVGDIYANFHSELSEAWNEWRKPDAPESGVYLGMLGKPEGEAIELADAIIRILDYAHHKGWDMDALIEMKMAYNFTRPYRHGGMKA